MSNEYRLLSTPSATPGTPVAGPARYLRTDPLLSRNVDRRYDPKAHEQAITTKPWIIMTLHRHPVSSPVPCPENGKPAIVRVIPALLSCRLIRITLEDSRNRV